MYRALRPVCTGEILPGMRKIFCLKVWMQGAHLCAFSEQGHEVLLSSENGFQNTGGAIGRKGDGDRHCLLVYYPDNYNVDDSLKKGKVGKGSFRTCVFHEVNDGPC